MLWSPPAVLLVQPCALDNRCFRSFIGCAMKLNELINLSESPSYLLPVVG